MSDKSTAANATHIMGLAIAAYANILSMRDIGVNEYLDSLHDMLDESGDPVLFSNALVLIGLKVAEERAKDPEKSIQLILAEQSIIFAQAKLGIDDL